MERIVKIQDLPIVCAQTEAVEPIYRKIIGKSGCTWLVPIGKFAADNIQVSDGKPGNGYYGHTMVFNLEDGSTAEFIGLWHTNSDALFKDTGLDIRNKHATKVIIAEVAEYAKGDHRPTLSGIVYEDKDFEEGTFNRGTDLAEIFADKLNKPVYYYVMTGGGAHSGWKSPKEKTNAC